MNDEELEKTIEIIQEILDDMGNINFYTLDNTKKSIYQKSLNKSYDKIYALKKRCEFLLHIGGNYEKIKDRWKMQDLSRM